MNRVSDKELIENQDKMLMLKVLEAIKSIKYGHVQITIHDSEVVQIDKTEKIRIRRPREGICK